VVWIAFHDAVDERMRLGECLSTLRDVAGKAAEQAARIAGVLQIVDEVNASAVKAEAMVRACELADWYLQEAARLAIEAAKPIELRDAQIVLGWIRDRGIEKVTAAFLQKHGPSPLRVKARLDPAIDALVTDGCFVPDGSSRRAWRVLRAQS
jgi:hypothetical protein